MGTASTMWFLPVDRSVPCAFGSGDCHLRFFAYIAPLGDLMLTLAMTVILGGALFGETACLT